MLRMMGCGWAGEQTGRLGTLVLGLGLGLGLTACGSADGASENPTATQMDPSFQQPDRGPATTVDPGPVEAPMAGGGAPAAVPGPDVSGPDVGIEQPAGPADDDQFCHVLNVTNNYCTGCHGANLAGGAPMKLVEHADFMKPAPSDPARQVYELVGERIHDTGRPMPPPPQMMTDPDKTTVDNWVTSGAPPPADPTCAGILQTPEPAEEDTWPAECDETNTYTLLTYEGAAGSGTPYTVPANSETHPQFIFDAPWGDKEVQMVAYRPIVGEGNVAHHWILYSAGGGAATGFGGQFLISWSPGKDEDHGLPDNVGIYLPSGPGSLRLDMHYYNLNRNEAVPDQTGLEVCVTTEFKEHSATVLGLTASATVPAGGRVDNKSTCTVNTTAPNVHLVSVSPHMHNLGVNGKLELTRNGMTTVLHDGPFNFEDQTIYSLGNVELMNGDELTTTCSYVNDTGRTVTFGQNTDDEMCFNFVLYYPMGGMTCLGGSFF